MPEVKKSHGAMNVDFSEMYDAESDTYYVTFKTGEPSYCVEADDRLLLEIGMFTNVPTGFRILGLKRHKINKVVILAKLLKRVTKTLKEVSAPPSLNDRTMQVREALEKVLV